MSRDALALLVILTAAPTWIALLWYLYRHHPGAYRGLFAGLLSLAPLIPWYLRTLRRWRRGEL